MAKSCPSCGTTNDDNSKFCTNCGSNVENLSSIKHSSQTNQIQKGAPDACLWCHQQAGFKEEEGKMDSKWGMTAHKMRIFICNNCGYAHLFGLGRSIWDFD